MCSDLAFAGLCSGPETVGSVPDQDVGGLGQTNCRVPFDESRESGIGPSRRDRWPLGDLVSTEVKGPPGLVAARMIRNLDVQSEPGQGFVQKPSGDLAAKLCHLSAMLTEPPSHQTAF